MKTASRGHRSKTARRETALRIVERALKNPNTLPGSRENLEVDHVRLLRKLGRAE